VLYIHMVCTVNDKLSLKMDILTTVRVISFCETITKRVYVWLSLTSVFDFTRAVLVCRITRCTLLSDLSRLHMP
jgi:hypothetical protein